MWCFMRDDVKGPWRRTIRRPTTMLESIKMLLLVTHWIKLRENKNRNCSRSFIRFAYVLISNVSATFCGFVYFALNSLLLFLFRFRFRLSWPIAKYALTHAQAESSLEKKHKRDNGFRKWKRRKKNGTQTIARARARHAFDDTISTMRIFNVCPKLSAHKCHALI